MDTEHSNESGDGGREPQPTRMRLGRMLQLAAVAGALYDERIYKALN